MSYTGSSGRDLRLREKNANQKPPIAMGTARSSKYPQRKASVWLKFGSMYQNRSTNRMKSSQLPSQTSVFASRLNCRESNSRNGTAKWKTTSASAIACQPEYKRLVKKL